MISSLKEMVSVLETRISDHLSTISSDPAISARCKGVGLLSKRDAMRFCAVGPTARASGLSSDIRATGTYAAYPYLDFKPVTESGGDVYSRIIVRLKEMLQSCSLIDQALDLPPGPFKTVFPRKMKRAEAIGRLEAPRGELFYYVRSNSTFIPDRVKIRTPTYANFSSLGSMLVGQSIAEIPIVFASIDPCIACTDRMTMVDSSGNERIVKGADL